MFNNKVTLSSATIKQLSLQALSGFWPVAFIAVLISRILSEVPGLFLGGYTDNMVLSFILRLYLITVGASMTIGLTLFFLNLFRGRTDIRDLRFGIDYLGKGFSLYAMYMVVIMFLSMLFIIPGIYASYKFGLCFYIFADNPTKTPTQCLRESAIMMRGNMRSMVFLDISFLGLIVLLNLPSWAAEFYFANGGFTFAEDQAALIIADILMGNLRHPLALLLSLAAIISTAYMNTAHSCFYDLAAGNLVITREE